MAKSYRVGDCLIWKDSNHLKHAGASMGDCFVKVRNILSDNRFAVVRLIDGLEFNAEVNELRQIPVDEAMLLAFGYSVIEQKDKLKYYNGGKVITKSQIETLVIINQNEIISVNFPGYYNADYKEIHTIPYKKLTVDKFIERYPIVNFNDLHEWNHNPYFNPEGYLKGLSPDYPRAL